jgi:hypothetical protein
MPEERSTSSFKVLVFALLLVLYSAANARGQYSASIQGTVTDMSGAMVAGATVIVSNDETHFKQQVSTSKEGFYSVTALPPGVYTIRVDFTGFAPAEYTNVQISAENTTGLNITLHPAVQQQQVTVTAQTTPSMQTENAVLSGTITSQEVQNLPQYGRDPYELLRLTPGVFGDSSRAANGNSNLLPNTAGPGGSNYSIFQTENMVQISSDGQRISDNNFLLDGVSANSLTWGGAAVVTPNQESVNEVQVVTNGYSAEYGRNSGAIVQVVSKNGTNHIHGSGFFKYDDPGLNAYNDYNGLGNPTERVNDATRQFGGSFGGPIKKNKLFYFFSYEGMRENVGNFADVYVLTPQFAQQVITMRPGGVSAAILQNPGYSPRVISLLPQSCNVGFAAGTCQVVPGGLDLGSITGAENSFSAAAPYGNPAAYVNNFSGSTGGGFDGVPDIQYAYVAVPSNVSGNQYNYRMDFSPTMRDTISGSTYVTLFNNLGADNTTGSERMADLNIQPTNSVTTLLWNHTFSPSILNQARANITRYAFNQVLSNPQANFGLPRVEIQGFPFASNGGRIEIGPEWSPNTPGIEAENTIAFGDTLSQVKGNKTFKYGVDVIKEQSNNNLIGGARPDIVFEYPWDFANDAPIFEEIEASPTTGLPTTGQRYFRTSDYAGFAQFDWKVLPNFTLNLGVRWEDFTPLDETRGEISNFVFNVPGDAPGKVEAARSLYNSDHHSFGPRLGFAYSPKMFHTRLVVRGGFGIFYNRLPEQVFDNIRQDPPFTAAIADCCGTSGAPNDNGLLYYTLGATHSPASFPADPNWATGLDPNTGGLAGSGVQIYGAFQNTPTPYVEEWSFGYEYNIGKNWFWDTNYEGSAGHKIDRLLNLNYLYPQPYFPLPADPGANCATTQADCYNPFSGGVFALIPDVNSAYDALTTGVNHRFGRGLYATVNYRYSKSIDESSWEGPCACTNETYPQDLLAERGPSDFDVTHDLTGAAVYDLPFLRHRNDWVGKTLGGWSVDPMFTYHSGFPWTPVSGQSVQTPSGATLAPTRPVSYNGQALTDTSNSAFIRPGGDFPNGPAAYFDFATSGPPGVGRNSFRGPHYRDADLSVAKSFGLPSLLRLGELANIEVRVNFFNIFNTLNLAPFGFNSASTSLNNTSNFGLATAGLAGRVVEFQGRFSF